MLNLRALFRFLLCVCCVLALCGGAFAADKSSAKGVLPLIIDPIADITVSDGQAYSVTPTLASIDPADVPATWTITSPAVVPGDMAIDAGTGEVTWTADFADNPVNMTILATGALFNSSSESWVITVLAPTQIPGAPVAGFWGLLVTVLALCVVGSRLLKRLEQS